MSGLEKSVALLARLVERLESNGVLVEELSSEDFFGKEPKNEDAKLFEDLVSWLLSEGVIRQNGEPVSNGFGFVWCHEIVLTARGFQMLEQEIKPNLTLANAVHRVSKGSTNLAGVGDLLGGFTKSISN